ncbi:TlpA family protein disulfide reductase [Paenibacillus eucommiae]|uniref:Peroxiredoxin n=1 Tax=Paenibacillus eucommiae TaxID=1355755 RepID=A0ABS4J5H4_9BACL|nr:redoxin domain-containing protein [Paenibacillus eucommiae]MBP1995078.1 peroxiredoxin [Paenibacillus eucommiae]
MRKHIFLWGAVLSFVLISIYVTNNYSISSADTNRSSSALQSEAANSKEPANEAKATNAANAVVNEPEVEELEPAIDFTLTDLNGNKVSLKDLRGKNVYINFWTTWCKWCKKEMPDMEKIHQAYKDQDLIVLAIDVGEDKDKVSKYIEEHNYQFSVLLDSDKSVTRAYKVKSIPVSIFIDRNGNIAHQKVGFMTEEQMKAAIDELQ